MGYEYEVFLSYRRIADVQPFVRDVLRPRLAAKLENLRPRQSRICLDETMESGAPVAGILDKVRRSKVLLGVWTPAYEDSPWTRSEWDTMVAREKAAAAAAAWTGPRLVLPIFYLREPPGAGCIKRGGEEVLCGYDFEPWNNANEWPERYHNWGPLNETITRLARDIAGRLDNVPAWRDDFPTVAHPGVATPPIAFPGSP